MAKVRVADSLRRGLSAARFFHTFWPDIALLVWRRGRFVRKLPSNVENADETIKGVFHRLDVLSWLAYVSPQSVDCVFATRDESLLSFGELPLNFAFDVFGVRLS